VEAGGSGGTYIRRRLLAGGQQCRASSQLHSHSIFAGAALADDWKEYENRGYAFTVYFPGDPTAAMFAERARIVEYPRCIRLVVADKNRSRRGRRPCRCTIR
jgi:hypothetical protein